MVDIDYPAPPDQDDERFRWLFDYWRERCRDGRLPSRSAFDPIDFPHLLGRIILLDVVRDIDGRPRYRIRLWGSIIRRIFDKDDTGRWLDETLRPGTSDAVHAALRVSAEEGRPHFWRRPLTNDAENVVATRRLLLPLAADGKTADMLIGLLIEDIDVDQSHAIDRQIGVA